MIFIVIFSKGHNSIKHAVGVMVLVLYTSSDNALYLWHVLWKYLKGFGNYYADMISTVKFSNGHNSIKQCK